MGEGDRGHIRVTKRPRDEATGVWTFRRPDSLETLAGFDAAPRGARGSAFIPWGQGGQGRQSRAGARVDVLRDQRGLPAIPRSQRVIEE